MDYAMLSNQFLLCTSIASTDVLALLEHQESKVAVTINFMSSSIDLAGGTVPPRPVCGEIIYITLYFHARL
jgi:hypothetical protein